MHQGVEQSPRNRRQEKIVFHNRPAIIEKSGMPACLSASCTNYGQSMVSVAAPRGDWVFPAPTHYTDMVLSPGSSTGYYFSAGTSMAAPHVLGVAALIVSRSRKSKPAQLQAIIQQNAGDILRAGTDPHSGQGRIHAQKAVH